MIEGNHIRPDPKTASRIPAISVVADRNKSPFPCRNVRTVNNTTGGTGIQLKGAPGENNLVAHNRSVSPEGRIFNRAGASLANNSGYQE